MLDLFVTNHYKYSNIQGNAEYCIWKGRVVFNLDS